MAQFGILLLAIAVTAILIGIGSYETSTIDWKIRPSSVRWKSDRSGITRSAHVPVSREMPFVPIVSIGNTYRDPHSSQVSRNRDGDINASTDMLSRSREYRLSNVSFECDVPASLGIYIARLSQRWNSGSVVWNGDYADCFGLVKRWDTAKILSIKFGVYKDTWLGKERGPSVFDSSHNPAGLVGCLDAISAAFLFAFQIKIVTPK